ncbi:hypothetical protein O6H91_20G035800 [Diphasiastrum complanatum]|uniref:Uncharacterized protein n=1 Tax=Diphasiastrum complanatum TaxID=34168 RepID=A0ACC2APJ0_DIPCM|nr:hypothetical protein O6H91_20G035800 [Diphasiastrum complanatum]
MAMAMAEEEGSRSRAMVVVKEERLKDERSRVRWEKPNPLAGRTGEGAPIAPPGWLWKAGNRARDMYFYSPSGETFRSQPHLQSYLATLPNPPPLFLFRFKVDPQEFKDGVLPGVPPEDAGSSARRRAKSGSKEVSVPSKRRKLTIKIKGNSNGFRKMNDHSLHPARKSSNEMNGSLSTDGTPEHAPRKINKKEIDRSGKKEAINTTFSRLLLGPTSYNVLSKNAEVLQKFLDEAARMKEKDTQEIDELRNDLLDRKHNAAQLSKYPESVLHVFYSLLRNEEAPASFGRKELIEFCSKWICKHKHHWCLLETSRIDTVENFFPKTSRERGRTECGLESMPTENEVSGPGSAVNAKSTETNEQSLTPRTEGNIDILDRDLILTAEDLTMKTEDSFWSKETIQKNIGDLYIGRESTEAKLEPGQLVLFEGSKPQSNKCGCQVCSCDSSFCHGCTCSLCKIFIQHKQSWTFIKCPICRHFCHLECALKAMRAGVVAELGMDGEFLCPCCLNKSDLVPFWIDRLKDALTSIDRPALQKYLTSAVLVLNGTQRQDFEIVHRSVMELHDSLLYNTPCPNLQQILQQIQEKMDGLSVPLKNTVDTNHLSGVDLQDSDIFQEEEKVLEGQKRAELDYVEWLIAEKNADTQRIILRDAQEQMKKAESDISAKAVRARASRTFIKQAERRLQLMKRNSMVKALSMEQLEKQRAAFDLELVELNKLQDKLGSFSSELHDMPARQFSSLLQDFKVQSKRVETVKARLEQIDCLNNFFS